MIRRGPATRREFLARVAGGAVTLVIGAEIARAQGRGGAAPDTGTAVDSSNLFAMDQGAAKPVRLPPKPGATPSMTNDARDDLEHRIRCQCSCTLDVYTCRTTDFSCQVSPAMHRDIMALVEGGYGAQEIIDAFVSAYGERALMAPRKSGFNLVGWWAPSIAVGAGAIALGAWLRRWGRRSDAAADSRVAITTVDGLDVTSDELARVEAAVRGDE
jgi:cytochrome c-type biogenesis protein CcmH